MTSPPQRIELKKPGMGSGPDVPKILLVGLVFLEIFLFVGVVGGVWFATGSPLYALGSGCCSALFLPAIALLIARGEG